METNKYLKGRKGKKGRGGNYKYDPSFQRMVVREYELGDLSLPQLGQKYGIDYRRIHEWNKRLNVELADIISLSVTEEEQKEVESLNKELDALKKKLEYEQMRNFALETMADLAKEQLGIDLRKNFGAKQPKE